MSHLLIQADARRIPLASRSVDCIFTSPPYWMQRDYGHESQIGMEPSEDRFVSQLLRVFQGIKPLLRFHACVFINLGDTYNAYNGNRGKGRSFSERFAAERPRFPRGFGLTSKVASNKSLCGIPWRFAIAMIEAGWKLRAEIIWEKRGSKPERVKDRPVRTHEQLFLFTISDDYHWAGSPLGSVWSIALSRAAGVHPAKMSIGLAKKALRHGCPEGGLVLDPFSGHATTGVAALSLKRHYIGCDLSVDYLAQAKRRIERPHQPGIRQRDKPMPLFDLT